MLTIGSVHLASPFILAPLAGYTDLPFRILCRENGAGMAVSEMISSHGLVYGQKKTRDMAASHTSERPVALQLFGNDPEIMAEAAALLSSLPIDIIDINMGCPVRKVVKKGSGSALLKDLALAARIIEKTVSSSTVPVTVKTRTGWDHQAIVVNDFVAMAETAGARAITLHARTWSDGFKGRVDYEMIRVAAEAAAIPVIGNGDITDHKAGLALMQRTGCDGIMIGRGALGAPWVFQPGPPPESAAARGRFLRRHLELIALHSPATPFSRIKNHAGRYFTGIRDAAAIRKKIFTLRTLDDMVLYLDQELCYTATDRESVDG